MDSQYRGMTVNERLYVSGLMDAFDKAVKKSDVEQVKNILKKVEIIDESTIKAILEELRLVK